MNPSNLPLAGYLPNELRIARRAGSDKLAERNGTPPGKRRARLSSIAGYPARSYNVPAPAPSVVTLFLLDVDEFPRLTPGLSPLEQHRADLAAVYEAHGITP